MSRPTRTSARNSALVGHNAQCGVDVETNIIVTHDVTNKGFDHDQFSPMALAAKEAFGREDLYTLPDKGYFSGVEIAACDKAGITVTMPRPETSGNRSKGMYVKTDLKYDAVRDVYICPIGNELIYRYTRARKTGSVSGDIGLTNVGIAALSRAALRARNAVSPVGNLSIWWMKCSTAYAAPLIRLHCAAARSSIPSGASRPGCGPLIC
jgi:hypothetical protein